MPRHAKTHFYQILGIDENVVFGEIEGDIGNWRRKLQVKNI